MTILQALPLVADNFTENFLEPKDRMPTALSTWERGGVALEDATEGLDVANWLFFVVDDELFVRREDSDTPTSLGVITPAPVQITGSFDADMFPIFAWVDSNGDTFVTWDDGAELLQLPARSGHVRLARDDFREDFVTAGDSNVVLAYVRDNVLYYRVLSDDFATEENAAPGFSSLAQIGPTDTLQFQFTRLPPIDESEDLDLQVEREDDTEALLGFDDAGNVTTYDVVLTGTAGEPGASVGFTKLFDGHTYFLRNLTTGAWINTTVNVTLTAYRRGVELRAARTLAFTVDARGGITRANVDSDGEAVVVLSETGVGTPSYTVVVYMPETGQGVPISLLSLGNVTSGEFEPSWSLSDFPGGGFLPAGEVEFFDHGAYVLLSTSAELTSRSTSTRLRWLAGSLPAGLRPAVTRSAHCVVSANGVTRAGIAKVFPDGSAEFWPLTGTPFVAGAFLASDTTARTKGLPATWQLVYGK